MKQAAQKGLPEAYYLFAPKKVVHDDEGQGQGRQEDDEDDHDDEPARALRGADATQGQLLADVDGSSSPRRTGSCRRARRSSPSPRTARSCPATRATFTAATQPVKTSPTGTYWYLFKYYPNRPGGPPEILGKSSTTPRSAPASTRSRACPRSSLGFNGAGGAAFQRITKAEWNRGLKIAGEHLSAGTLNQLLRAAQR